jgi:hypothetical protein
MDLGYFPTVDGVKPVQVLVVVDDASEHTQT